MKPVKVRNVDIGTGMPKICVPVVGVDQAEIISAAKKGYQAGADIVEWRVDWFNQCHDYVEVENILCQLRKVLGETPLLFTFRTDTEGGEKGIDADTYVKLNRLAVKSGYVDLIDAELFTGDEYIEEMIRSAHEYGVKVILSNHDFEKTPNKSEIISRLVRMQELGADISKIAVMPQNKQDLLTLLTATEEMYAEHAKGPIITMSMAAIGVVSRFCGEVFGSAVTFGAAGEISAPGQMEIKELRTMLEILHDNI